MTVNGNCCEALYIQLSKWINLGDRKSHSLIHSSGQEANTQSTSHLFTVICWSCSVPRARHHRANGYHTPPTQPLKLVMPAPFFVESLPLTSFPGRQSHLCLSQTSPERHCTADQHNCQTNAWRCTWWLHNFAQSSRRSCHDRKACSRAYPELWRLETRYSRTQGPPADDLVYCFEVRESLGETTSVTQNLSMTPRA